MGCYLSLNNLSPLLGKIRNRKRLTEKVRCEKPLKPAYRSKKVIKIKEESENERRKSKFPGIYSKRREKYT